MSSITRRLERLERTSMAWRSFDNDPDFVRYVLVSGGSLSGREAPPIRTPGRAFYDFASLTGKLSTLDDDERDAIAGAVVVRDVGGALSGLGFDGGD